MLIYGHRGASGMQPENTLVAFRQAIDDGADGIEFDVRATADGVPVLLHDRDIGRTTDGHGFVDELTLAELRQWDAGSGEQVPTLAEALELVADRVRLNIEIKQRGIEQEVINLLGRYPFTTWAISSFDWNMLQSIRARHQAAELVPVTFAATDDAFVAADDLGATSMALHGPALTPAVADRLDVAGLEAIVWTVNRVEDARLAQQLGVAALITDVPATVRQGLAIGSR